MLASRTIPRSEEPDRGIAITNGLVLRRSLAIGSPFEEDLRAVGQRLGTVTA